MAAPVLALRLEGPLQAWGDSAKWSVRDTRAEPTFSGVVGLIAAASGWRLEDAGDQCVAKLAGSIRMAVRADREGVPLRDYHTIGGVRSGIETAWTGLLQADGRIKRTATTKALHTEVSERNYLCDACFLVMLQADEALLQKVEDALTTPVWPPFLGRKACVPSAPVWPASPSEPPLVPGPLVDAIKTYPWLGRSSDTMPAQLRVVMGEGDDVQEGLRTLRHDVPRSYWRRIFSHRYVREFMIPTTSIRGEG